MKVLSIGNSFSQDATRYLHQIARAEGCDLLAVNLYIGGCPLSLHYENMQEDAKAYSLEVNGCTTGFAASIREALLANKWDYVTLQQVSHLSHRYESYQPYLNELAAYVRSLCPGAELLIHQTWAYEQGSKRLTEELGYQDQGEMYRDLKAAYEQAAAAIEAKGIIPSGTLFQELLANGIKTVHRDTFHASLGLGRYALGLLWYGVLTGNSVLKNPFRDFDEPVSEEEVEIVKRAVCAVLGSQSDDREEP